MDAETLEALKGSIAKWEAIVAGTGKDEGPMNCPLCRMFHGDYRKDGDDSCAGCPVAIVAADTGCGGTPYADYDDADPGSPRQQSAAVAELDFLKSLLPVQP